MEIATATVVGLLIVFIGLICLIALVTIMGMIVGSATEKKQGKAASEPQAVGSAPVAAASPVIPDRDELIVAFSAAVAEELGTDVSAIRVVSFKEI